MCTIVCPDAYASKLAVPRRSTESIAAASASMRMTTRACSKSMAGELATVAPAARTGSALRLDRVHTTTGVLARTRLSAIGCPMTPSPMKPVFSASWRGDELASSGMRDVSRSLRILISTEVPVRSLNRAACRLSS
jgi:hypothetical protein